MQSSFWQKEIVLGVRRGWLAVALGFYIVLLTLYAFILAMSERSFYFGPFLASLVNYMYGCLLGYSLKFILSIPLVYLYFKTLKNWTLWAKVILHIFTCIAFVLIWQKTYYFITEFMNKGHLRGSAQVWDLYIPALIYIIQFAFLHAFEFYYGFQKQKELEHQLRQASLQSELSAIRAQLNPHFLYNVFNTISASVPPEQEKTREMIAELSDLFRYQLKASRTELVPLREELDFTEKYLALEKARFGERLRVKMDIDPTILDEKIPSMIIQPIVENSLKHGLASKIEGGEVFISIKKMGDVLRFKIADTGVGFKDKDKLFNTVTPNRDDDESIKGVGLKNTQLRLEKLYHSTLHFEDNKPEGLIVRFDINLNHL
jgi:two-component system, LytTR family, sensor kinase